MSASGLFSADDFCASFLSQSCKSVLKQSIIKIKMNKRLFCVLLTHQILICRSVENFDFGQFSSTQIECVNPEHFRLLKLIIESKRFGSSGRFVCQLLNGISIVKLCLDKLVFILSNICTDF